MTTDLTPAIAPKSDQLNADDLIAGPKIITIASVSVIKGEQPITIRFEGDDGKPYKPCKSMGRVLVLMWGADGKAFTGRRLQLIRDPDVQFGPDKVGGIRISHMSDIDGERTVALTTTRGRRKPFMVKPLPLRAGSDEQVRFGKTAYDPAEPAPLPYYDDFADKEWRAYADALKKLIARAPSGAVAHNWERQNQDGLLVLAAQKPALRAEVLASLPKSAALTPPADEGAPGLADGSLGAGAPSPSQQERAS